MLCIRRKQRIPEQFDRFSGEAGMARAVFVAITHLWPSKPRETVRGGPGTASEASKVLDFRKCCNCEKRDRRARSRAGDMGGVLESERLHLWVSPVNREAQVRARFKPVLNTGPVIV